MISYDALPHGFTIDNRYWVEGLLGKGRSSAVYRAFDAETSTQVSLKILDPFLSQDPVYLERFRREVSIIRSLSHPGIVKVYDFLKFREFYVIVMEYFESRNGIAYLDRYGAMPVADFLDVAKKIVSAIESCHKVSVLHRDIKPQNVLISQNKDIKVVDFGISRVNTMSNLTKTGTILGTPEYMPPELFITGRSDTRSDIYSLGCVFFEFLTKRPPYSGESLSSVISQQIKQEITNFSAFRQDVPPWLEKVILKCLRTDSNKRYQSCGELLLDIEKGERALVGNEMAVSECWGCKMELIPGLIFCHNCGKFSHDIFEKGVCAIVLHRCDNPNALSAYLLKAFPDSKKINLTKRFKRLPTLLFKNISKNMAHSIVNELANLSLDLSIVESLPKHFQLPYYYFIVGLLPLILILVANSPITFILIGKSVILGELFIIFLYRQRVRSIITLGASGRKAASSQMTQITKIAARFRNISHIGLRSMMGNIVQKYLNISSNSKGSAMTVDPHMLTKLVWSAFDLVALLEKYENFLDSMSLNSIKANIDKVQIRLGKTGEARLLATLLDEKSKLDADFARYYEIQEKHAKLHRCLLDLRVALNKLDASLELSPEELLFMIPDLADENDVGKLK